jgi:phosphoglycolate phosphatase-like HAD superfamily hydrolase
MIGDRAFDGEGASACGVDFIWASYGFGTAEEINALKPIYIARKALSIKKFILE